MRKIIWWTALPLAVAAASCGRGAPAATMSDDLKHDLQLAGQAPTIQISPDEVSPQSHKAVAAKPVEAPHGPRLVRSHHPTVKAAPAPTVIAEAPANVPQAQTIPTAPAPVPQAQAAPTPTTSQAPDDAPPIGRPAEIPQPGTGRAPGTYPGSGRYPGEYPGRGGGSTIGGILGAIFGGIGVGDDDHCEPPGRRRRGGYPNGGWPPVGVPMP